MVTLPIHKADGSQNGSLELSAAVFGCEPNLHCVRQVVAQYLANQRAGTHSTRTRGMVRGGGRKPYRQKGTGHARQGSIRATQWRGGSITFGPHPRDYSYRINRKVRDKAFCSVWSDKVKDQRLVVLENFGLSQPKTKELVQILEALKVAGPVLLITDTTDLNMVLSARNIPWVKSVNADNINIYDLVYHDWIVATPEVLKRLEATYS